jgi:transcriptional regulator with XRE-family HTH domain
MNGIYFGKTLKTLRNSFGISSKVLSKKAGKAVTYVSQLERGLIKKPCYYTCLKILNELHFDERKAKEYLKLFNIEEKRQYFLSSDFEENNFNVELKEKEIVNANILTIKVGTNCPQGGDTGHGGKTFIVLEDSACTDMRLQIDDEDEYYEPEKIKIMFGGDTECITIIEALKFAVKELEKQFRSNSQALKEEMKN